MSEGIDKFDEEYRQMVARNIKNNDPTVFHNGTIINAKDIVIQFLDAAKYSVEIMTGSMAEIFYNDKAIHDAFVSAAGRLPAGAIRIITTNTNEDEIRRIKSAIKEINNRAGKNNEESVVYRAAKYNGNADDLRHFMLVDGMRYRWEFPHCRFSNDLNDVSAQVCCFDRDTVKERTAFFDAVWNKIA